MSPFVRRRDIIMETCQDWKKKCSLFTIWCSRLCVKYGYETCKDYGIKSQYRLICTCLKKATIHPSVTIVRD
jgi:hypothetical protein